MADFTLTTGDDTLTGTAEADLFSGEAGGTDSLVGGGGDDRFVIGYTSGGTIDGGDGIDTLVAEYDVSLLTLTGIEVLAAGSEQMQLTLAQVNQLQTADVSALPQPRVELQLTGDGGVIDLSSRAGLAASSTINGYFASSAVTMIGSDGDDHLIGAVGVDSVLRGGLGNDRLETGQIGAYTLDGGEGNDTLVAADNVNAATLTGGAGDDTFVVGYAGGPITLDGGEGVDALQLVYGDLGAGTFSNIEKLDLGMQQLIMGSLAQVAQFQSITTSNTQVSFGLTGIGGSLDLGSRLQTGVAAIGSAGGLSAQIDLTLTSGDDEFGLTAYNDVGHAGAGDDFVSGMAGNDTIFGNAGDDRLFGDAGDDVLDGGAGRDTIEGGAGNDTFIITSLEDEIREADGGGTDTIRASVSYVLLADNIERVELTGNEDIDATGNDRASELIGNAGRNLLDGGAGIDTLRGGAGNDIYLLNDADRIEELAGGGDDLVLASINSTLAANVERLTLTGAAAISGAGNAGANIIIGNMADNQLNGGGGADTMIGGAGNDSYVVDNAGDSIVDTSGIDLVRAAISYTLTGGLEQIQLLGSAGISATGNALANKLIGNAGANLLDGKQGVDTMIGGKSDDTYVVDATDVIVEIADGGIDELRSSASYTLGANLERLVLSGTGANGTGNTLANFITGTDAANLLDGNSGADTMAGGAGWDTYIVDDAGDVVVEAAVFGGDIVRSSVSFTLPDNVETLELTGTANINAKGSAKADTLVGNSGNNVLASGGTEASTAEHFIGGAGNDTYIITAGLAQIDELAGGGTDTVQSSGSYRLDQNVERLVLTGRADLEGRGNDLANALVGNAGKNWLNGGEGHDTLTGGAGADTFEFSGSLNTNINVDRITDFTTSQDHIALVRGQFVLASESGTLGAAEFHAGAAATTAGQRIIYDKATGSILYDADGSGAGAAVKFAQITAGLTLTADDFVVI